jgi:hypothetical protein
MDGGEGQNCNLCGTLSPLHGTSSDCGRRKSVDGQRIYENTEQVVAERRQWMVHLLAIWEMS